MFKIVEKKSLNPTVTKMTVEAPLIAKKAEPGQFIIFRAKEDSERIPLTIADYDREAGTVTIIYQIVGAGTSQIKIIGVEKLHSCMHEVIPDRIEAGTYIIAGALIGGLVGSIAGAFFGNSSPDKKNMEKVSNY